MSANGQVKFIKLWVIKDKNETIGEPLEFWNFLWILTSSCALSWYENSVSSTIATAANTIKGKKDILQEGWSYKGNFPKDLREASNHM